MAANDPPAPNSIERAYGVTNIKSHIPVILDLNDHNYDAWRELFQTYCLTFNVLGHLDGTLLPTDVNDAAWYKRDGLVKLWIYGTLAPQLFRSSFQNGGTARDVWQRVENQFRNNKEARAIQLDNELRTQEIGDRTIQDYCQKIKSLADLLTNVDAPVNERKFDNIINVIKHKDPFPTFEVAKSMLEMEESRLLRTQRYASTHKDHSSSTTALTVTATSNASPRPSNYNGQTQRFNNYRGRRNNYRGSRGGRHGSNFRPNFYNYAPPSYWSGSSPFWPYPQGNWSPYHNTTYRPPASNITTTMQPQAHLMETRPDHTTETMADPNVADWFMD